MNLGGIDFDVAALFLAKLAGLVSVIVFLFKHIRGLLK